jgi:sortase family protein
MRALLALFCMVLLAGCGAAATGPALEPVSPEPASSPVVVAPPEPVGIAIPRLRVSDEIVPVGICAKAAPPKCSGADELEVPDVHQVGWYSGSPRPGAVGPALLAGHVNWHGTPGSFARIGTLRAGDEITVTDKVGIVHRFEVYAVKQFAKADYDANMPTLLANTDSPELRLVTCSGDLVGHDYQDNTVVSAREAPS